MKAIVVSESKECVLDSIPLPVPCEGQVLIKNVCAPIHKVDIQRFRGTFSHFSGVPGYEGAGTVVRTGSGFKTQKLKGKNVCFFKNSASSGTWSEYVLCDSSDCCVINEEFGFIRGSTMMYIPLTMIMIGKIIKKKKFGCIINTSSTGILGKMIVKWCNHKEVTCINIVKNDVEVRELIEIGAKYVLNAESKEILSEFYNICDKLKPVACFDGLGGEFARLAFKYLKPKGYFYMYDCSEEGFLQVIGKDLYYTKKTIKGLWMPSWFALLSERKKQKYYKKIQKRQHIFRVDNVIISPVIDVLPFFNDYFHTMPPCITILDFSDLSKATSSLISPLPSPKPAISKSQNSENSEESSEEDLTEILISYQRPEVLSFISTLPDTEKISPESKYIMLNDSSIYHGKIREKKPEGFCHIYYSNGDVYQGHFELSQRKGKGRLVFSNFDWFEGSWKDDFPAGSGIFHFNDGRIVQGNFLHFEIIGSGIEILQNGESYEGGFLDKKRNGKGTLVTRDWRYEGKFKSGEMFGFGVVKFNDGKEFSGEFNGNIGTGLLKYTDFTYFEGKIVNFLEEGEGEIVNKEGIRRKGLWEQGKFKNWVEEEVKSISAEPEIIESGSGISVEIMSPDDVISLMVIK